MICSESAEVGREQMGKVTVGTLETGLTTLFELQQIISEQDSGSIQMDLWSFDSANRSL
jgi:hypothetical protein